VVGQEAALWYLLVALVLTVMLYLYVAVGDALDAEYNDILASLSHGENDEGSESGSNDTGENPLAG
jgi:hypothetical protein